MSIKPLTKRELTKYFSDYRREFPDWAVKHDFVLVRHQGPIEQHIAFEGLRGGSYRPSHSVHLLVGPDVTMLSGFLDIKHRDVLPREHVRKFPLVIRAMEEQFRPSIRRPLDVEEVLRLAEEDVTRGQISNLNDLSGLAALSAYVGDTKRAFSWSDRVEERVQKLGRAPADWELRLAEFARGLRNAIQAGNHRSFLEAQRQQG